MLVGSYAIQLIAILSQKSSILFQDGSVKVISSVNHKPPVTPPAQNFLPSESLGSNMTALVRPPTLSGPCSTHSTVTVLDAFEISACSKACIKRSLGTCPVAGSRVIKKFCSAARSGRSFLAYFFFQSLLLICGRLLNGCSFKNFS